LYYVYTHLLFGLSSAIHAITKLWKPVTNHMNELGIRNTVYIDDGRILATTESEIEKARKLAYEVVAKAGWVIEASKSDGPG